MPLLVYLHDSRSMFLIYLRLRVYFENIMLVLIQLQCSHIPFKSACSFRKLMKYWILSLGFSGSSVGKESTCNAGDLGSISGLGRSPGQGRGYPLQYSGLESSMDCIVHGVTKSQTRLSDFYFLSLDYSDIWSSFRGEIDKLVKWFYYILY